MSDELREIISYFVKPVLMDKADGEIEAWHIRERKKWALDLLTKTYKSWLNSDDGGTFEMVIRKKIEEA